MKTSAWTWSRARLAVVCAVIVPLVALLAACGGGDEAAAPAEEQAPAETGAATAETAPEEAAPAEQVTLRAVSFLPIDNPNMGPVFPVWVEHVEEATNGAVKIEYRGGPEAIPAEEQLGAVASGVVDVTFNVGSFVFNQVPSAQFTLLSPFTPGQERENGFFDFLDRQFMDAGAKYLGRYLSVNPFYLWTNEDIAGLADFQGQRIRSAPAFDPVVQGVGANPVFLVPGDIFTALERGVIDGFAWPLIGPVETGWTEITKNIVVNAPYYNQNGVILINPDTWERLGPDVQQQVLEATAAFEEEMVQIYLDVVANARDATEQAGVNFVELPQKDSDRFATIWYENAWEFFGQPAGAEVTDEAKQLLEFEEIKGDPERIRQIPCAGTEQPESIAAGCGT